MKERKKYMRGKEEANYVVPFLANHSKKTKWIHSFLVTSCVINKKFKEGSWKWMRCPTTHYPILKPGITSLQRTSNKILLSWIELVTVSALPHACIIPKARFALLLIIIKRGFLASFDRSISSRPASCSAWILPEQVTLNVHLNKTIECWWIHLLDLHNIFALLVH